MSPRRDESGMTCSKCKEKTPEIWFSEQGMPLCLICFSAERFEKIEEAPISTPRKTLNSNPLLRMCSLIEQKLMPGEKKKRSKSGTINYKETHIDVKKENEVLKEEEPTVVSESTVVKVETSCEIQVKEEKEEEGQEEESKRPQRRKKRLLIQDSMVSTKKTKADKLQTETQEPEARGRRSIFKQQAFKAPDPIPSLCTSNIMYFEGIYYRKGDIVSLTDIDGGIFYAQIRGFMQDQYCEKSAAITWLLPVDSAPPPELEFNPNYYVCGPEEDVPRKLEYMTFVMHAPSDYFYDESQPYKEYPRRGVIYQRLRSAKRVIKHNDIKEGKLVIPEVSALQAYEKSRNADRKYEDNISEPVVLKEMGHFANTEGNNSVLNDDKEVGSVTNDNVVKKDDNDTQKTEKARRNEVKPCIDSLQISADLNTESDIVNERLTSFQKEEDELKPSFKEINENKNVIGSKSENEEEALSDERLEVKDCTSSVSIDSVLICSEEMSPSEESMDIQEQEANSGIV